MTQWSPRSLKSPLAKPTDTTLISTMSSETLSLSLPHKTKESKRVMAPTTARASRGLPQTVTQEDFEDCLDEVMVTAVENVFLDLQLT